ncbi:HAD family hydrolase [Virgibacillus sp. NKC19-3]|uniref:HAD family hydrolase n=1 Tax=Virgibacillus saliphilus TaxID=2831674 RepID=UPI001C9B1EE5|nr:HAD family hydrolase [Virgibacillus sp. NKC19-3]MBY7142801.1 HAD family hydrolase [Virgibacillus sp. NKC19-3]
MIKAILFDLDDTLLWDEKSIKEAFKATCQLAAERYAIDPALLEANVRKNAETLYASYDTYDFTTMIGISAFEGLWGNFADEGESFRKMREIAPAYREEAWTRGLKDSGIDNPAFAYELASTFPVIRKEKPFVYNDTFRVLDQLTRNYQLLLLTNGSPDLQQTKLNITPELAPYFDHIVISGDFGKGKPAPTIFEHALELLSIQKDEALMVGDNLMTDILGASRAGIDSVWVNRKQKVANEVIPTYEITELEELVPLVKNRC